MRGEIITIIGLLFWVFNCLITNILFSIRKLKIQLFRSFQIYFSKLQFSYWSIFDVRIFFSFLFFILHTYKSKTKNKKKNYSNYWRSRRNRSLAFFFSPFIFLVMLISGMFKLFLRIKDKKKRAIERNALYMNATAIPNWLLLVRI